MATHAQLFISFFHIGAWMQDLQDLQRALVARSQSALKILDACMHLSSASDTSGDEKLLQWTTENLGWFFECGRGPDAYTLCQNILNRFSTQGAKTKGDKAPHVNRPEAETASALALCRMFLALHECALGQNIDVHKVWFNELLASSALPKASQGKVHAGLAFAAASTNDSLGAMSHLHAARHLFSESGFSLEAARMTVREGLLLRREGHREKALELFQSVQGQLKAMGLDAVPVSITCQNAIGAVLVDCAQRSAAFSHLHEAARLHQCLPGSPESALTFFHFGRLLLEEGHLDEAKAWLSKAEILQKKLDPAARIATLCALFCALKAVPETSQAIALAQEILGMADGLVTVEANQVRSFFLQAIALALAYCNRSFAHSLHEAAIAWSVTCPDQLDENFVPTLRDIFTADTSKWQDSLRLPALSLVMLPPGQTADSPVRVCLDFLAEKAWVQTRQGLVCVASLAGQPMAVRILRRLFESRARGEELLDKLVLQSELESLLRKKGPDETVAKIIRQNIEFLESHSLVVNTRFQGHACFGFPTGAEIWARPATLSIDK